MVLICNDLSISLFHFFFWYGVELPLTMGVTRREPAGQTVGLTEMLSARGNSVERNGIIHATDQTPTACLARFA